MATGNMKYERPVNSAQQRFTFTRRTMFIGAVQAGIGMLLAGRMAYIAVANNEKYRLLAESNRVNLTLIPPRRGWFIDRMGKPIATNRADFRVDIIPDRLTDKEATLAELAKLLSLSTDDLERISREIKNAQGFQPVQIKAGLDYESFARVSVHLPDLPGVSPRQGFSRYYPSGPAVGHLIGYVGAVSAEEYAKNKDPLLITPGYKIGKEGLEKYFEPVLQGKAGAKRVEVTARGKIIRELASRNDVPGKPVKLTIDIDLQNYAARRIGEQSGSVVVIDCESGDILAFVSMPSYDPNRFSNGIGRKEWDMFSHDDHLPLINKASRGLYPPGSTMKPMATLALQLHGVSPEERVSCPGGFRLGSRFFRCDAVHGSVDMRGAIEHSCNTYFWSMAHRVGYDAIAPVARLLGLGQEFQLPGIKQRYGTIPDAEWKMRRYKQEWSGADSLNSAIGQGYVLASPLQLAVMTSRIASGRNLQPALQMGQKRLAAAGFPFTPEQLAVAHDGMFRVVNGSGTGTGSRIDINGVKMAGKTGTAQVRAMVNRGHVSDWKSRDHSLFVCYAPTDVPRYAMSVVIEHGTFGARAAAPIAKDAMTFLFDPEKAMAILEGLEAGWGGTPEQRMESKRQQYMAQSSNGIPMTPEQLAAQAEAEKAKSEQQKKLDAANQEEERNKAVIKSKAEKAELGKAPRNDAQTKVTPPTTSADAFGPPVTSNPAPIAQTPQPGTTP
jgi:penicillin-binding protein 2